MARVAVTVRVLWLAFVFAGASLSSLAAGEWISFRAAMTPPSALAASAEAGEPGRKLGIPLFP